MSISEETLMAFADGEVDESTRAAVESAMREDPEISKRVESHRAMRRRLQAGFAGELLEPVPERFLAVLRDPASGGGSNVVNLKEVQAARARATQARAAKARESGEDARGGLLWRTAPAVAAALVLGLVIGYGGWRQGGLPIGRSAAGMLVANGALDGALSDQLTSERGGGAAIRVGISYLAKSGDYCRTFRLTEPAAGIACRRSGQWQIQALAQDATVRGDGYRPAATALPPLILKVVEDEIQGQPLDATGESAARERRWQSPK